MELFSVERNKCQKDGICASVCPMALITLKNERRWVSGTDPAGERVMHELRPLRSRMPPWCF